MAYSSGNIFANGLLDLSANNWNNSAYNQYMAGFGSGALDFGQNGFLTDPYQSYMQGGQQGSPPNSTPTDPANYVPRTPGGNDWINQPSNGFGGFFNVGDDKKTGLELGGYPTGYSPGAGSGSLPGSGGLGGFGLRFDPKTDRTQNDDFGFQGVGPTGFLQGGFDPWAGNPYAKAIGNQIYGGFLQNGQIAGQTSQAIWDTMKRNQDVNAWYAKQASDRDLEIREIEAQQKANEAYMAELRYKQDEASRLKELELANLNAQLEFKKQELATLDATKRYDIDATSKYNQGSLDTKKYEIDANSALGQGNLDAKLQEMQNALQLGLAELKLKEQQGLTGQSQLDWERERYYADQKAKSDWMTAILGMFGQSGGFPGLGGGGSGGAPGLPGSGGGSAPGGIGFTSPGGQFLIGTGITATGLNPNALRQGVSAIEGSGAPANFGSSLGMTPEQQRVLSQDLGQQNLAYGQEAATDWMRKLLPQNAQLWRDSDEARRGMNLQYAGFGAEQERNRKNEQLGGYDSMLDLLRAALGMK